MKLFTKIILFSFILFLFNIDIARLRAEPSTMQVDLGVKGCNFNGICEDPDESLINCPVDCPPPASGSIPSTKNISLYNLVVEPDFNSAIISWKSSVSTKSTIRWGETTEVKAGTLTSVVFALNHRMEIINLKPGTMYYFTIESKDSSDNTNIYPPTYFFTKFLKDTTFPLAPRNVKTYADISGITITWENPPDPDFSYVRIMRHTDRFRGDPFLGKLIYEGSAEKFLDSNVTPGKKYFYVLFSRNKENKFSSGVGISETAFSEKKIPPPVEPEEIFPAVTPPETFLTETFFVHQYNQIVELLTNTKVIQIDGDKSTVVDTNSKTLADDWMKVTDQEKKVVGQYLFSFNVDSGRYQSVIPPLEKKGFYNVKIYRYKDNIQTIISEGSLEVRENMPLKTEKSYDYLHLNFFSYYVYIILLLLTLFLLLVYFQKRQKKQ